ncbi:MAG: hypothetical protein F2534_03470 [Actinobacteria bacterium]|nr:hypothetical protein [Actinomycetota bacterium]
MSVLVRANVRLLKSPQVLEAHLFDLGLTISAPDDASLIPEIRAALIGHYIIAKRAGRAPFADMVCTPGFADEELYNKTHEVKGTNARRLDLPSEVREALSTALGLAHRNGPHPADSVRLVVAA